MKAVALLLALLLPLGMSGWRQRIIATYSWPPVITVTSPQPSQSLWVGNVGVSVVAHPRKTGDGVVIKVDGMYWRVPKEMEGKKTAS